MTRVLDTCLDLSLWDGFAGIAGHGVDDRVELPDRSYLLARGPVDDALPSLLDEPQDQSPNLWWPRDRAWIVATEVDYAWTYVGGSRELTETLLAEPQLEALPALLTHKPFYDSDLLNAALDA